MTISRFYEFYIRCIQLFGEDEDAGNEGDLDDAEKQGENGTRS